MGKAANSGCERNLMLALSQLIARENPYARSFKMMFEVLEEEKRRAQANNSMMPTVKMFFHTENTNLDLRRYNIPVSNEVFVILFSRQKGL